MTDDNDSEAARSFLRRLREKQAASADAEEPDEPDAELMDWDGKLPLTGDWDETEPPSDSSGQMSDDATVVVVLVRGTGLNDEPLYAYVALMKHRMAAFMEAKARGTFRPEDFGVVVESGEGEPPEAVRLKMEAEYGFRHELAASIPDAGMGH